MLDYEKLAAAMGELDEDTMVEMLNGVMARRAWTPWASSSRRASTLWAT